MLKEERTTKATVVILVIIGAVLSIFAYQYSTFTSKKIVDIASHEARSDARIEVHDISQILANKLQTQMLVFYYKHLVNRPLYTITNSKEPTP